MFLRSLFLLLGITVTLQAAISSTPIASDASPADVRQVQFPDALKAWQGWALWGLADTKSPTPYNDQKNHLSFWPSRLGVTVGKDSGSFDVTVAVFAPAWVPLPGGGEVWPLSVNLDGKVVPVVEHERKPSLYLQPGTHRIEGKFLWDTLPQRLSIPREIGLLDLRIEGEAYGDPAMGCRWGSLAQARRNRTSG